MDREAEERSPESVVPRVAFVTGGASGLGRAIVHRLAQDGSITAIADIDDVSAQRTAKEVEAAGGSAMPVACDVSDYTSVASAAEEVVRECGGVDVLVNNAGFDSPDFFLQTKSDLWDRLIAVNLIGVLNCTHVIAPKIVQRARASGYGRIVNIASDAGRVGSLGEAVYSAAKGGVIAFTKSIARELARDKVTVNAVCPGPADTPMTEAISATPLGQKMMERMMAATPLKRLVAPEEVAGAVAYFVAEDAAFTTGQALSLSGGLTMV